MHIDSKSMHNEQYHPTFWLRCDDFIHFETGNLLLNIPTVLLILGGLVLLFQQIIAPNKKRWSKPIPHLSIEMLAWRLPNSKPGVIGSINQQIWWPGGDIEFTCCMIEIIYFLRYFHPNEHCPLCWILFSLFKQLDILSFFFHISFGNQVDILKIYSRFHHPTILLLEPVCHEERPVWHRQTKIR